MASRRATRRRGSAGVGLLEQLSTLDARGLSPETARQLLDIRFTEAETSRVNALSQKAQAGALLPEEEAELDDYIRAADALAVLQSRARQARTLGERPA